MTRVGKILESLNKRRKFNEAWNIPSNLRDKKLIKNFLDNASRAVREYVGHTFECDDLSKYIDYKTKKVSLKDIKDTVRDAYYKMHLDAFGIILETEDDTVIWTKSANYGDRDYWAHLIHKDGTYEKIRERELPNYTGRAAKATKGYLMIRNVAPSYGMSYGDAMEVDPLDQVDKWTGNHSTLFSKTKDGLVNLMKLRKALTKIKIDLTKESIQANAPKVEKAMNSGVGVELILDGETYLLYSGNNNQLPWEYKANFRYNSWILLDEKPALARSTAKDESVLDIKGFLSPDYKLSKIIDHRGTNWSLMVRVDTETGEITLNKNFKWSKYRGQ